MPEKAKVPAIRFKGFNNAWEQRELNAWADRYDNLRVPITASDRVAGSTPYYGANGIQDYVEGYTHDGEFILVAEDGASDLKNYPVQYVNGRIWVNNHAHVLQAKKEIADNKFLKYVISQTNIEPYLVGGGRAKLNADTMMRIFIIAPENLEEQKQLGTLFQRLDNLTTLHQRKLLKLKNIKKAMLEKMFPKNGSNVPEIRFGGFTDAWEQRKLGNLTQIKTGSSDLQDSVEDGQYPFFVRSENIERSNRYIFDGEAILIPGEGRLGDIYHYINGKFDFHQRVYKISGFEDSNTDGKYILYYMQKNFKQHAMRFTVKATVDSLRLPMLTDFDVVVPKIEEQRKISNLFANLDSLITLHQRKYEKLQNLKKACLQKMFV